MSFAGPIADRLAIRELFDRYGDAVIRHDAEGWTALWAEDAVWALRGREIAGRAAIGAAWSTAMAAYSFVSFSTFPAMMRISGDHATTRANTLEFLTPLNGPSVRQHGRYEDELIRAADGGWMFARRAFTPLHVG
jgi:uncharacterized protein (TIGR02246 family)